MLPSVSDMPQAGTDACVTSLPHAAQVALRGWVTVLRCRLVQQSHGSALPTQASRSGFDGFGEAGQVVFGVDGGELENDLWGRGSFQASRVTFAERRRDELT